MMGNTLDGLYFGYLVDIKDEMFAEMLEDSFIERWVERRERQLVE